jgi:hypothetical protein
LIAFLYIGGNIEINGLAALIPAGLACAIRCICVKEEQTPCNASMSLISKALIMLRLLIGITAFLKTSNKVSLEWSTTFWPFWCTFAINVIMGLASLAVLTNTIMSYYRQEAIVEDSKFKSVIFISMGFILGLRGSFRLCFLLTLSNHQDNPVL